MRLSNYSEEFKPEAHDDSELDVLLVDEAEHSHSSPSRFVSVSWSPAPSTTSVLLFLLVVDIGVCLYIGYLFHSTLLFQEPNTLEYRNPYINLEKLYSLKNSTTRYQPIASAPRLAVQVNPLYPDRAYDSEHQLYDTGVGMLSPSDRHLKVNAETHTVAQFRTVDFGMEKCSLVLRLPSVTDLVPHGFNFSNGTVLDVCSLDIESPIDIHLTWVNRPHCRNYIGRLAPRPGEEVPVINGSSEYRFPCKWGTLHAFEISCSAENPQCGIDFWSNEDTSWGTGLIMYQFQTV